MGGWATSEMVSLCDKHLGLEQVEFSHSSLNQLKIHTKRVRNETVDSEKGYRKSL